MKSFLGIATLIGFAAIGGWFGASTAPTPQETAAKAARAAEDAVERRPATLRHPCRAWIKDVLREPGSVEWIDRDAWPVTFSAPDVATVEATYRARNGFGGMTVETIACTAVFLENGDAVSLGLERIE